MALRQVLISLIQSFKRIRKTVLKKFLTYLFICAIIEVKKDKNKKKLYVKMKNVKNVNIFLNFIIIINNTLLIFNSSFYFLYFIYKNIDKFNN